MTEQEMLELETTSNEYYVKLDEALKRLESNKDFQDVILNGYCKDKALAGVMLLGRHDVKKRGERPDVMEELVAISNLQDYFSTIKNFAGSARVDMAEDQAKEMRGE
ncbi:hypothetical protein [Campylobacter curvus]|jgi:hypothetical protein|uniref:hypothetical protein n=1 Tax=Campylobacter curvus TaxID=200 RepID=UPI0014704D32|nr:hypothetical protein [Campylobacter curvus]